MWGNLFRLQCKVGKGGRVGEGGEGRGMSGVCPAGGLAVHWFISVHNSYRNYCYLPHDYNCTGH